MLKGIVRVLWSRAINSDCITVTLEAADILAQEAKQQSESAAEITSYLINLTVVSTDAATQLPQLQF